MTCSVLWRTDQSCSWREYHRVIKMGKKDKLDANGRLQNGKKPHKERELQLVQGTRHQLMSNMRRHFDEEYKRHNYDNRWISKILENLPMTLLESHLFVHNDFSAYPRLRPTKELNCTQGSRASLYTGMSQCGTDYDVTTGYATSIFTVSHLHWTADLVQDPHAVNHHRGQDRGTVMGWGCDTLLCMRNKNTLYEKQYMYTY